MICFSFVIGVKTLLSFPQIVPVVKTAVWIGAEADTLETSLQYS